MLYYKALTNANNFTELKVFIWEMCCLKTDFNAACGFPNFFLSFTKLQSTQHEATFYKRELLQTLCDQALQYSLSGSSESLSRCI